VWEKLVENYREFLWEGATKVGKLHELWECICRTKEDGGLGEKDLDKFNIALLGK